MLYRTVIKASVIKQSDEEQNRYILFPYQKKNGKNRFIAEDEIIEKYPLAYAYFCSIKPFGLLCFWTFAGVWILLSAKKS